MIFSILRKPICLGLYHVALKVNKPTLPFTNTIISNLPVLTNTANYQWLRCPRAAAACARAGTLFRLVWATCHDKTKSDSLLLQHRPPYGLRHWLLAIACLFSLLVRQLSFLLSSLSQVAFQPLHSVCIRQSGSAPNSLVSSLNIRGH